MTHTNTMKEITCIILDVEGTTTSIDFVRKELFSYGNQNIENYVIEHWNKAEVKKVLKELSNQDATSVSTPSQNEISDNNSQEVNTSTIQKHLIAELKMKMLTNQKTPAIKELEGLVWLKGFFKGDLKAHLYPDVLHALKFWNSQSIKVYIYSNGSVESQRVLFQRSVIGDLSQYIHGYFDTNIGSKLDPVSYSKICQEIGKPPNEIMFFSDHPKELLAAQQTGLKTVLVVRDPDCYVFAEEKKCLSPTQLSINSFLEVLPENAV